MRHPIDIKRQEAEAQRAFIRSLYASLPRDPMTTFEFEWAEAIWRDIEYAEKELAQL